jgi:hypothetical protein
MQSGLCGALLVDEEDEDRHEEPTVVRHDLSYWSSGLILILRARQMPRDRWCVEVPLSSLVAAKASSSIGGALFNSRRDVGCWAHLRHIKIADGLPLSGEERSAADITPGRLWLAAGDVVISLLINSTRPARSQV